MKQEEKSLTTRGKILDAAYELFTQKGFEATTMQDIMTQTQLSKGAIYHHFGSKEEIMQALGDQLFLANNPFDAVRERTDLNALQKIHEVLSLNQADDQSKRFNLQALPILKDPRILAAAIEANRRILTPLWLELLEEGRRDGSIETAYPQELAELLPLINFWFIPSLFPASEAQLRHKARFVLEVLAKMGLPLTSEDILPMSEDLLAALTVDGEIRP